MTNKLNLPDHQEKKRSMEYLPHIIALAAIIASPIGAYLVARYQSFASHQQTVATMRQAWIDSLRDRIAELASEITIYNQVIGSSMGNSNDEVIAANKRVSLLTTQIELMLNPVEQAHVNLMNRMYKLTAANKTGEADVGEVERQFLDDCKAILKEEWIRVKAGK